MESPAPPSAAPCRPPATSSPAIPAPPRLADGIWIDGGSANIVLGNDIGTDLSSAANLGNYNNGITIESSANNEIGGASPGDANLIAFNNKGISVWGSGATGNSLLENSIFSNTAIGIDLGDDGITANTGTHQCVAPRTTG